MRSGRTDTDGRLIEDDVPEVRLRLTLETGEVVVFDDSYATAAVIGHWMLRVRSMKASTSSPSQTSRFRR